MGQPHSWVLEMLPMLNCSSDASETSDIKEASVVHPLPVPWPHTSVWWCPLLWLPPRTYGSHTIAGSCEDAARHSAKEFISLPPCDHARWEWAQTLPPLSPWPPPSCLCAVSQTPPVCQALKKQWWIHDKSCWGGPACWLGSRWVQLGFLFFSQAELAVAPWPWPPRAACSRQQLPDVLVLLPRSMCAAFGKRAWLLVVTKIQILRAWLDSALLGRAQRARGGKLCVYEGAGRNVFVLCRAVALVRMNYCHGFGTGLYLFRLPGVRKHCW